MQHYAKAEISSSAVRANMATLRALLPAMTRFCAVVKADCYGHGLEQLLGPISAGADCLAVATPEEAGDLRRLGYEGQIVMFLPACAHAGGRELRDAVAELIAQRVTLTVVSSQEAAFVAEAAKRVGVEAEVHVKIDTGMTRSGALLDLAPALVEQISAAAGVRLTGMYTHFAAADEADKTSAREQFDRFMAVVRDCGLPPDPAERRACGLTLHAANSAATIDLPETHLDMVRPGIALYGYQPSDQMLNRPPLRPVLRAKAMLVEVKDVPAGSRCGYGLTYTFQRDGRVGLVPIGYADGYPRNLSNRSTMQLRGRDVPVRGRVSMDQIILDLTDMPDARVGDEVEVVSADPAAGNSIESLARLAGTIPYELTCRLGRRIARVPVD